MKTSAFVECVLHLAQTNFRLCMIDHAVAQTWDLVRATVGPCIRDEAVSIVALSQVNPKSPRRQTCCASHITEAPQHLSLLCLDRSLDSRYRLAPHSLPPPPHTALPHPHPTPRYRPAGLVAAHNPPQVEPLTPHRPPVSCRPPASPPLLFTSSRAARRTLWGR